MRLGSIFALVYVLIGIVVASQNDYLNDLDRLRRLLSAILAVVLWPLVLFGLDIRIR